MDDTSPKMKEDSLVEGELDLEIKGLQAGEGRSGSNTSQSNGCCIDPAFLQNFLTSGAALARHSKTSLVRRLERSTSRRRSPQNTYPKGQQQQKKRERRE